MSNLNFIDFKIRNGKNRSKIRKKVVLKFLEEEPGTGKGEDASRYNYKVEKLKNKNSFIFLSRPAILKNGFDFAIRVHGINFNENSNNRKTDKPSHQHVINDLLNKRNENLKEYKKLYKLINDIYQCKKLKSNLPTFNCGYPVDMILGIIKWFFIEQDIRYWNYSGRYMFMSNIPTSE